MSTSKSINGEANPAADTIKQNESAWAKPVEHLEVSDVADEAMNINVEGKHLTGPLQGFGQLWQKTYRIRLESAKFSPEEVVKFWKTNLPDLMPENSKFYPSMDGVQPGEVLVINAKLPGIPGGMPVSTGVMILYADHESFAVMTPDGHPESGFNTFSAYQEDGVTVVQIQSLARANDPVFEIGFRYLGGGTQQERIWHHVLEELASNFGVAGQVEMEKICVDNKLQWSYAKNVWHNSVIRTTFSLPAYWVRQMLGRD